MDGQTGTFELKKGLAQMLKGGVIMDVVTPEQARIAEAAEAVAVMALERVPADIRVQGGVARNAFGRQVDSFETDLSVPALSRGEGTDGPYPAVFIRAPLIEAVAGSAEALARLADGRIVAARQGRLLATAFHPELTRDDRFHRLFVEMAADR